jgi:hypothetical protein
MFHAGSGETGAGMFTFTNLRGQIAAAAKGTFRMLVPAAPLVGALVDFVFEHLPLVTMHSAGWTGSRRRIGAGTFKDQFPLPLAPKFLGS